VSPIPEPYPNFLAVAEVTRRRPTALSTWLFVTPQGLRRSPEENPALQAVVMALEVRDAIGALTEKWRRLGHEIGFGIGIAHGFATLGTIGYVGRFDYAAIGTVSNVASRLCDEAKPGQILISPRVLMKVEKAVKVEPVGEFELKGIRRPLAAYNVVGAV
jgi:adenylate cyclase